jgi:hypothetical protein
MPQARLIPLAEVGSSEGVFKFIKVAGEYRFCSIYSDHNTAVDKDEIPKVEAAGAFAIHDKGLIKGRDWSMTLNKGCTTEHFEELSKLFGKPITGSLLG